MRLLGKALTFDDVLLVPAFSQVLPRDTDLSTRLSRNIRLNLPLVSAAMDTVTESRLAIALAQEGGIGIIHKNLTPKQQAAEVARVKRYESGVLRDPITVTPDTPVRQVVELSRQHGVSGFPVLGGPAGKTVVGIVTNRDLRFESRLDVPVSDIMTPRERLVTVDEAATLAEGKALMHRHKLERVLVVNDAFELRGLMTVKDITKQTSFPDAARDAQGKLRVGAAVGVGDGTEERVELLVRAGVDAIVVDTAHGHSAGVVERVRWVKKHYPKLDVIGGNIATGAAALALVEAGADAVKVGIGPGSICTTRIVTGVGVPQIFAIENVEKALRGSGVPLIADGGVRYSGDLAKAIAAGADTVMMGGAFAGTEEAPGETILYQGRTYKSYRGMGSIGAMQQGSADRYFQDATGSGAGSLSTSAKLVPEGIEGQVPYKGSVVAVIFQMAGGLRASMHYCGCASIAELHEKAEFVEISSAGMRESHVHDVQITKESPELPHGMMEPFSRRVRRSILREGERGEGPSGGRTTPASGPALGPPSPPGTAVARKAAMPFIMAAVLIDMVSIGLIIPVLPVLVGTFTTSQSDQAFWSAAVTIAFGIANFFGSPILGRLSDRYGRRPVLLIGFSGLALSFFVTGLATHLWMLLAVRIFSGAMQSNVAVANAYVADITAPADRARSFGKLGAMLGFGFILGPVIGGLLGSIDVHLPFFAAGSLAIVNWMYGWFVLPESLPPERRQPFVLREANPVAALRGLGELKGVGALVFVMALSALAQFMTHTSWVLYTTFKFGWGPLQNGWSLLGIGVMSVLVQGVFLGRLLKRFTAQRLATMGLLSSSIGYVLWGLASEGWMLYAVMVLNVLGFAVAASLQGIVSNAASATAQGRTLGAVASLNSMMAVVAPMIGGRS